MGSRINHGTVNTQALAEYFIQKFNLAGRDSQYKKGRFTLNALDRDTKKLMQSDGFKETVKVAGGFSSSPDWVEGNRNHKPSKKIRWSVDDPFPQYGFVAFDNLMLKRNEGGGSLFDVKGAEADDVSSGMLDTCEYELWNDGTGVRGQAASLSGTAAAYWVTLSNEEDVYQFPYSAIVSGNTSANGSGTQRGDRYEVDDVDPQGGRVHLTRTTNAADPIQANDYIHVVGSAGAYMPGIPTFIPSATPSDTLYGVARGANPATSGWRFAYRASIGETIGLAFSKMGQWVDQPKQKFVVCLSTSDWYTLSQERESKVIPDPGAVQKWGLNGLLVNTTYGTITCVAVPQMKSGRGYILDFSTWKLYTLGNLPHVIDEDGQTFVRLGVDTPDGYKNGDAVKMQMRMWKTLLCLKPMANATFPTVPS